MNSLSGGSPTGSLKEKIPSGYKKGALQQFTPQQMELFSQLFQHVSPQSYLSRLAGGDEKMFQDIEAPAMRQFGDLQAALASKFSGMGTGARKSSGFMNTSNQAASDFAMNLQAQRQQLQRQALMDLMGLSEGLLGQRPFEQFLVQKQQNQLPGLIGKLFGAVPGAATGFASGGGFQGAASGIGGALQGAPSYMQFLGGF